MAGTTNDKLNQLRQTKEKFRTAITGKGQPISDNEPFSAWPDKVAAISGGSGNITAQAKTVTPSTSQDQVITPDNGYNYLSQVTVKKISYTETPNAAGGTTVTIG